MKKIGWIGIGNMGKNMAHRVLDAGYALYLFDTNRAQMQELLEKGAQEVSSAAELARTVDIVFSTIPNGKILRAITYGDEGVAAGMSEGKVFVDISTVDVETSAQVAETIDQTGGKFIRCPVSGSTIQAGNGTLVLMVSGDKAAYESITPVLELFGQTRYYLGANDEARVMKLVIQSMLGTQFQSYAEALILGEKAGVDWKMMVEILCNCSAASTNMRNKKEAFQNRDFSPMSTVFTQLKDMNLVMDLARQYNVPMPTTAIATQYYNAMVANERGNFDYAAILLVNEEACGIHNDSDPEV